MKQSALHHLESKRSCYDYLGALLRLTDNSFTADVPVSHGHISVGVLLTWLCQNPYANFLRATRVFNYLTLVIRSGQLHGIDLLLPHRPKGNLLVWCPACPEPGMNGDPNCLETPRELRYAFGNILCSVLRQLIGQQSFKPVSTHVGWKPSMQPVQQEYRSRRCVFVCRKGIFSGRCWV
jgi:hypothetical protein